MNSSVAGELLFNKSLLPNNFFTASRLPIAAKLYVGPE